MRGSEDDTMAQPQIAAMTEQLISAAAWLAVEGWKAAELQMDTAGRLHVYAGNDRAVFQFDGSDA